VGLYDRTGKDARRKPRFLFARTLRTK